MCTCIYLVLFFLRFCWIVVIADFAACLGTFNVLVIENDLLVAFK